MSVPGSLLHPSLYSRLVRLRVAVTPILDSRPVRPRVSVTPYYILVLPVSGLLLHLPLIFVLSDYSVTRVTVSSTLDFRSYTIALQV